MRCDVRIKSQKDDCDGKAEPKEPQYKENETLGKLNKMNIQKGESVFRRQVYLAGWDKLAALTAEQRAKHSV